VGAQLIEEFSYYYRLNKTSEMNVEKIESA